MTSIMAENIDSSNGTLRVDLDGSETQELRDIILVHIPEFLDLFVRKNKEYGENAQTLGPRGQFSDMYRKMIKLKTAMWDGEEEKLTSEGVDEILMDLIGHCLLTLRMRREQDREDVESSFRIESSFADDAIKFLYDLSKKDEILRTTLQDLVEAAREL